MNRTVTLTDEKGSSLGEMELLKAHTNGGSLHRAMSVYIFDADTTMILLQKRSLEKLLFAGIWANTCCSHPFPHESAKDAGERRLIEEMGFGCSLTEGPAFVYRADDPRGNGTEHEYDSILTGMSDPTLPIEPDPREVADWKWVHLDELSLDMKKNPSMYAPWFHIGLPLALSAVSHGK